jgi:hypothetical protein
MGSLKNICYVAAILAGIAVVVLLVLFGYRTRTETLSLTYFPDNTYQPASNLPDVDERGQPKVVMVRRSGQADCFDVFYSNKLREFMEAAPSRQAAITYRIRYRMGRPFWVETLDVAGLGAEPTASPYSVRGAYRTGDVGVRNCF